MFSQFTPTTSFRRKAKHTRLEPPIARVGLSGAGFFFRLSFSESARPTRSDRRRKRYTGAQLVSGVVRPRTQLSSSETPPPPETPQRRRLPPKGGGDGIFFGCTGSLRRDVDTRRARAPGAPTMPHIGRQQNQGESYRFRHVCICNGRRTRERGSIFEEPENSGEPYVSTEAPGFTWMDGRAFSPEGRK